VDRDWAKTCDRIFAILNCALLFPKASELRERDEQKGRKKKAREKAYTKEVPATAPASVLCSVMTEDLLVCYPLVSSLVFSLSGQSDSFLDAFHLITLARERGRERDDATWERAFLLRSNMVESRE
jgi:hypothetical protein